MAYTYTKLDVSSALIGLCRAAGVPVAGGVGSYQLRAVDSKGGVGLFEQINEGGGVRRLVPSHTARTKREACMMIATYRAGIEAARGEVMEVWGKDEGYCAWCVDGVATNPIWEYAIDSQGDSVKYACCVKCAADREVAEA